MRSHHVLGRPGHGARKGQGPYLIDSVCGIDRQTGMLGPSHLHLSSQCLCSILPTGNPTPSLLPPGAA
jgi:hypothetical protein